MDAVSTVDRAALVEQAMHTYWSAATKATPPREQMAAALPVIAKALLAPLREMHPETEERQGCCATPKVCNGHPNVCGSNEHSWINRPAYPCPTVRLLDALEAEMQT